MKRVLVVLALALSLFACSTPQEEAAAEMVVASAFDVDECAACGMLVRDQPAPRGQIVHRDGTRVFLCSLSDMTTYLGAPSAHGAPKGLFVEEIAPDFAPTELSSAPTPWLNAADAHYVVGVDRPRIMGTPALAYRAESDASRIAASHGASLVTWPGLPAALSKSTDHAGHSH